VKHALSSFSFGFAANLQGCKQAATDREFSARPQLLTDFISAGFRLSNFILLKGFHLAALAERACDKS
jgi:hypothetical protein